MRGLVKMTAKIWTGRVENDADFTEVNIRNIQPLMELKLMSGDSLVGKWPKIVLDVRSDYPPADSFRCGLMLLVTRRLAQVIFDSSPEGTVEFLPVEVVFQGESYQNYGFLNIIPELDALDREMSEFTEFKGRVDSIQKMRLKDCAGSQSIFRLDSYDWVVCVSEALAEKIEKEKFTGVAFEADYEWRPF